MQISDVDPIPRAAEPIAPLGAEALEALDLVSDGFMLLDADLRFLYLNRTAEQLAGCTREQIFGQSMLDVFPALQGTPLAAAYRRAVVSGEPVDAQAESPSGRLYDVHIRIASSGIYVTFRDVTDRRVREEALQTALASEQVARIAAQAAEEESKRRQEAEHFLTEAGRVLASSLDFETTLRSVARLAVPRLTDWCIVHVIDEQGSLRQLAMEHQDPERALWAWEMGARYPPDLDAPHGVGQVLRTGRPEIFPTITDEIVAASARDEEHLEILRKVGLTSAIMVPMVSRDRVLGVISLLSSTPGRRYADEDLRMAERLAQRAAMAVDNALLFRAAQQEIGERTRAQEALHESELRYRTLTNAVSQLIWMNDASGDTIYFNEQWEQYLGVPVEERASMRWLGAVHPDDRPNVLAQREAGLQSGEAYEARFRLRRYDGMWRWHMARVVPIRERDSRVSSWIGAAMDIHEMQMLMEQLTIRQREVEELNDQLRLAMTETHHRVKNNLQIMAAMVDMQTMDYGDMVPVNEMRRLNRHIRTLAVIHDLLTQKAREDGRAEELSAKAILVQLLPMLRLTSGVENIDLTADDALLSSRQGTSLALVTNELISNARKHGKDQVQVFFTVQDGTATLKVCDDGPGFPPAFDASKASNTGLELVENLSRWDLDGRAVYENGPEGGACVRVEFPV